MIIISFVAETRMPSILRRTLARNKRKQRYTQYRHEPQESQPRRRDAADQMTVKESMEDRE
jgi:hypothetical protein